MKKIFISTLLVIWCALAYSQGLIYHGNKSYKSTIEFLYKGGTSITVTIGVKEDGSGLILVKEKNGERIKGLLTIWLEDNTVIKCIDRDIYDKVNHNYLALYYLTKPELISMSKANISTIRLNKVQFHGGIESFTASNGNKNDHTEYIESAIAIKELISSEPVSKTSKNISESQESSIGVSNYYYIEPSYKNYEQVGDWYAWRYSYYSNGKVQLKEYVSITSEKHLRHGTSYLYSIEGNLIEKREYLFGELLEIEFINEQTSIKFDRSEASIFKSRGKQSTIFLIKNDTNSGVKNEKKYMISISKPLDIRASLFKQLNSYIL